VQVLNWGRDPDLALRYQAAAGALLQLGLALCALGLWRAGELTVARLGRRWLEAGARARADGWLRAAGGAAAAVASRRQRR